MREEKQAQVEVPTDQVERGAIDATVKAALSPMYLKVLPTTDQWGTTFKVYTGTNCNQYAITGSATDDFLVASYGRDATLESWSYLPATPELGLYTINSTADFAKDLVNLNGSFIHGPRAGATGSSSRDGSGGGGDGGSGQGGGGGNGGRESNRRGLDGVGGNDHHESACAGGDAALGKEFAQTFDGATDAFLRGVFRRAKGVRHLASGLSFKVA